MITEVRAYCDAYQTCIVTWFVVTGVIFTTVNTVTVFLPLLNFSKLDLRGNINRCLASEKKDY